MRNSQALYIFDLYLFVEVGSQLESFDMLYISLYYGLL